MHKAQLSGAILTLGITLASCGGGAGSGAGAPLAPVAPVSVPSSAPVLAPSSAPSMAPSSAPTTAPSSAPTTTGFAGDAKLAQVNGKTILVDATTGLALYFFNGDTMDQSNCTGGCLAIWPIHAASSSEKGSSSFSIFMRSDGNGLQWAYKGRPLYTFISDTPSANATGNGIQNFVLATP